MNVLAVFRDGLRHSLKYWQIVAILFLASLLEAFPFILLPALSFAASSSQTAIRQAADGMDAWLIIEALASQAARGISGEGSPAAPALAQGVTSMLLFGLLAVAAAPFLAWITTALLNGGILTTYSDAPLSFRGRRFIWGCRRWFGRFLLLGFLQGVLGSAGLVLLGGLALISRLVLPPWMGLLLAALLLLMGVVGWVWVELTRAYSVARGERNLWHAALQSMRLLLRRPLVISGVYALALLLLGLLHAAFRLGILANVTLAWWPVALFAQQVFILSRLWAKTTRLASGVVWVRDENL